MSENYVKKYDVGQIKLDLPYANYIHELPLLSFGDVQHTINLNLIFNYQRKVENNNPFYIAPGFQLNLQKRIIMTGNEYNNKYQDEYGKFINLNRIDDNTFTFQDDSQRILRRVVTSNNAPSIPGSDIQMSDGISAIVNYYLEYPDGSKEKYTQEGFLIAVYDKYSNDNALFTYTYEHDKLSAITYNGKTIGFSYTPDNLSAITYGGKTINIQFNNNNDDDCLTITYQDSLVKYELTVSAYGYTAEGSSTEESGEVKYSQELAITGENNQIVTISDKIGNETINTLTYTFPKSAIDAVTDICKQVEITDNNGVKTRVQYEVKKPKYSYEYIDDFDNMFYCGKYTGNISIYHDGNAVAKQTYNDSDRLGLQTTGKWYRGLTDYDNPKGYFLLSGWIKSPISPFTLTLERKDDPDYEVSCTPNQWTYFAFIYKSDATDIIISMSSNPQEYETRDFKIVYLPDYQDGDWEYAHLYKSEDILNYNGNNISLNSVWVHSTNGNTDNIIEYITAVDILKYKMNIKKGIHNNEAYFNDIREIISTTERLTVEYGNQLIDIANFQVGKKVVDDKDDEYIILFNVNEGSSSAPIVQTNYVNGIITNIKEFNSNLDVISTTSDGITTSYSYNEDGLIISEGVEGLNVQTTSYATLENGDTQITVTDEFNNSIVYTMDNVWGVIKTIKLPDDTVITNTYDDNMGALMNKAFAVGDSARRNYFDYANGRIKSLSHGTLNYTFGYSDKGELASVSKNSSGVEHHTHSENEVEATTTVESNYPNAENPLYTNTCIYDKYGRLKNITDVLENVYDIAPVTEADENGNKPSSDNRSAVLSTSTDLLRNEMATYEYTSKGELIKKTVTDKDDSSNKISEETFTYDDIGRLTKECYYPNPEELTCTVKAITYEKDDTNPLADGTVSEFAYATKAIAGIILPNHVSYKTVNEYDDPFHRLTKKTLNVYNDSPNSTLTFDKCFTYDKTRISDVEEHFLNHEIGMSSYEYDNMGRISSMSVNGNTASYTYDAYGQLVGENNQALDKTFQYVYNGIGNIESVTSSGNTINFGYTDTAHPDRLTSYNNKAITYNANGGVATYDGWNYNWNNRGKLASITTKSNARALKPTLSSSKTYSFTYNALGQRTTSNYSYFWVDNGLTPIQQGEVTSYSKTFYYDHAGRLLTESISETLHGIGNASRTIKFIYDESSMIGFEYSNDTNESVYYYQRNLLGDVIAIYDTTGNKVVEYAYDAWGNCTIKGTTTNYVVAHANPIRYRGYYYDEDTKLYYLNARYYSPEFRRFISPDHTSYLDSENVNGLNLYCYCNNDPVNYCDPSGNSPNKWWEWVLAGVVVAGLIIGAVCTGGTLVGSMLTGAAIGAGMSLGTQALGGELNWSQFALDIGVGALTGLIGGSGISRCSATILGGGIGAGSNLATQLINGEDISIMQIIVAGAIGAAAGYLGGAGARNKTAINQGKGVQSATQKLNKVIRRIANGTRYKTTITAQIAFTNAMNGLTGAIQHQMNSMFATAMFYYGLSTISFSGIDALFDAKDCWLF